MRRRSRRELKRPAGSDHLAFMWADHRQDPGRRLFSAGFLTGMSNVRKGGRLPPTYQTPARAWPRRQARRSRFLVLQSRREIVSGRRKK